MFVTTMTYDEKLSLDYSKACSPISYEYNVFMPYLNLDYRYMVTDSINYQCAGILLRILTQWKIQGPLYAIYYLYMTMSILPISDALLIRLRLSLNHLTAAPVIATEPCNTTFERCWHNIMGWKISVWNMISWGPMYSQINNSQQ